MKPSPVIPPHPLDHAGVLKIALGKSASVALRAAGPHFLIIATPADSTSPEAAQVRFILHCLPLEKKAADDAFRVATGRMRAVKLRTAGPSKPS